MDEIIDYIDGLDPKIIAAIIAAVTSLITLGLTLIFRPWIESLTHKSKVQIDYDYEQKKRVKDTLAVHKIQILNSADSLKGRIANLFSNEESLDWISVNGNFQNTDNYYFHSTTFRILDLLARIVHLNRELVYMDTTIASNEDTVFLKYLKVIQLSFQKYNLFDGLEGELTFDILERDVIYRNDLEELSELLFDTEFGKIMSISGYKNLVELDSSKFRIIHEFLDGISPNENRLRYDRLVVLYLVLIPFLDRFGYDYQKVSNEKIKNIISRLKKKGVLPNFTNLIERYHLSKEKGMKRILKQINKQK